MTIDKLKLQFEIPGKVSFAAGPNGRPTIELQSRHAEATVSLYGAHVLQFKYQNSEPILWLSQQSHFTPGKAIRGGIPVCWPWFGRNSAHPDWPLHGVARLQDWAVFSTTSTADSVSVCLVLPPSELTKSYFPFHHQVMLTVTVSDMLEVCLATENKDNVPFDLPGALHNYFAISAIENIHIAGLDSITYHDSLLNSRHIQNGPIHFSAETDRIYTDTPDTCHIVDPGKKRTIIIEKSGSKSTVIWNPWIEKAKRMPDFGDNEYLEMVCVETANAAQNTIQVQPGETHELVTRISLRKEK
ncbi:D-hexose-6-phosphate mutarotase [bacterium]|nr:D-hexose-6-phosphate mutarotase [bacterium]